LAETNRVRPISALIGRKLRLARLALTWERAWRAAWPPLGVLGLFAALALLDALPHLPGWLHALVLLALALALGGAVLGAWRRYAPPGREEARRRLESASGLDHRPLAAMEDTLAVGGNDPDSSALWRHHQERMAEAVRRLRVGAPRPGLARLDRLALRGGLVVLLAVGLAAGWSDADERLARAVTPDLGIGKAKQTAKLDVWITPPAYTGLAPIFPTRLAQTVKPQTAAAAGTAAKPEPAAPDAAPAPLVLKVPAGSKLQAQVQGPGGGLARLLIGETAHPFEQVDRANNRLEMELKDGGAVRVDLSGETLGSWSMEIVPDRPPTIAYQKPPQPTVHAATGIAYTASDDYGLATARAEIRRTYEKGAIIGKEMTTLELALPGRNLTTARESAFHDMAPHKWAGMPVVMELVAVDALGQEGRSEALRFTLPERQFNNPVARAIIEQRKRLTSEPHKREDIVRRLVEIASDPATYQHDTVVFLALITARGRLTLDQGEKSLEPVRGLLWDTALRLEDGRLSIAERELRRAQEALMKALAENASDAELERLMAELRRALDRYLRAMAEQMMKNPQNQQVQEFDPSTMQMLRSTDLQKMLDQIRELMRSGAKQAAREMLARLQQMMENMRAMRVMRQRGQQGRGQGAMQQLQRMIQRQQQLMDQSFRQQQQGMRPGPGQAMDQQALQRMLQQFRQMMQGMQPGQGQGPGQFLDRANEAMERAIRSLQQGQPGDAAGQQGQALDQLRRAGRGIMQQMMERFARESGMGRPQNQRPGQPRRDPLGRDMMGSDTDSSDVQIPDESAVQRAREILDELRRRSGQNFRPRIELDYIERLLHRF
jgi:uncharacterized protein (TIGR02302 family)